jgi:hypothetical protein
VTLRSFRELIHSHLSPTRQALRGLLSCTLTHLLTPWLGGATAQLDAAGNQLVELDAALVGSVRGLTQLDLSRNRLRSLPPMAPLRRVVRCFPGRREEVAG